MERITLANNTELIVIIPCFNEASTVEKTVNSVLDLAPDLELLTGVLLVDDGSTDGTTEKIEGLVNAREKVSAIFHRKNRGVGRSMLDAYRVIPPEIWATSLPGDDEFKFESVKLFLEKRHRYDVILGYLKNPVIRPLIRRILSDGFTWISNFLYGLNVRYFNGMALYKVSAFKGINVRARGHAFMPELLAKAILRDPELKIGTAPFVTKGRTHGHSKAFRLTSIIEAILETYRGYRSIEEFRERVINADSHREQSKDS